VVDEARGATVPAAKARRLDVVILWGGIAFSLAFSALIWWAGERLAAVPHLPDTGPAWYYWKLPEPTFWSRATAWGFYLLHQLTIWGLIYYAQRSRPRYTTGLHKFNIAALAASAFFISLHFVQTHLWYDGLAQDVSVFSSQGSVIVLLVWVVLAEKCHPCRDQALGPNKPFRCSPSRRAVTGFTPLGTVPLARKRQMALSERSRSSFCP
jgi:hypothetical protein